MEKTQISARIEADSINPQGDRLTTLSITFPRFILAEINTHRMLSKNTSSSRAIPFKKMVEAVQENPFIPIAWQKEHKGMQGSEYITDEKQLEDILANYDSARNAAINRAEYFTKIGVTKQLANRLLEPFMWTTMLITGSKEGWDNFFSLRCPDYVFHDLDGDDKEYHFKSKKDVINKFGESEWVEGEYNKPLKNLTELEWLSLNKGQAEIHIMDLAEKIYDAMNNSEPKQLQSGEWHIPFVDKIGETDTSEPLIKTVNIKTHIPSYVKISTAMAARTSYTVVGDEKEIDYTKMIALHDRLLAQNPPHSSPMEHCARAMSEEEYETHYKGILSPGLDYYHPQVEYMGWCRNFKGFIPYRHIIESGEEI